MRRGEIWWADLDKRRPVVLLSRNEAYLVRQLIIIAPISQNQGHRCRGFPGARRWLNEALCDQRRCARDSSEAMPCGTDQDAGGTEARALGHGAAFRPWPGLIWLAPLEGGQLRTECSDPGG